MTSCALRFPEIHLSLVIKTCTTIKFLLDLKRVLDKKSFLLDNVNVVSDNIDLFKGFSGHVFYIFNTFNELLRFAPITELQTILLNAVNIYN